MIVEDLEGLHEELSRAWSTTSRSTSSASRGGIDDFRVRDDAGNEIKFTEPLGD